MAKKDAPKAASKPTTKPVAKATAAKTTKKPAPKAKAEAEPRAAKPTKKLAHEKNAGKPSPQLIADMRKQAEAAAETKVRAVTNERDGLRSRIKELESSSEGAADRIRLEKLEEKLMELQIERDSFRERL